MLLKATIVGNVGRVNDVHAFADTGRGVLNFTVAHNERWTDRQTGQPVERVHWVNCAVYGSLSYLNNIRPYIYAGRQVLVEGLPSASPYMDKEGQPAASLEIRVSRPSDRLILLGSKLNGNGDSVVTVEPEVEVEF